MSADEQAEVDAITREAGQAPEIVFTREAMARAAAEYEWERVTIVRDGCVLTFDRRVR